MRLAFYISLLIVPFFTKAQGPQPKFHKKTASPIHGKFVGLNTNHMLNILLPFNTINDNIPAADYVMRRLYKGHGYRYALGFRTIESPNFVVDLSGYLSFGYTHKRLLVKNFYWNTGFELKAHSDFSGFITFFGVSTYCGIEYHLNDKVSFSTEASTDIGEMAFDIGFRTSPPVNIVAHFNVTKVKKQKVKNRK